MVTPLDALLIVAIFFAVFYASDSTPPTLVREEDIQQKLRHIKLQRLLLKYRLHGVDANLIEDMFEELVRRGVNPQDIPQKSQYRNEKEWAANIELKFLETPYKHRDMCRPGEDRTIGKSTLMTWARPPDEENGDD